MSRIIQGIAEANACAAALAARTGKIHYVSYPLSGAKHARAHDGWCVYDKQPPVNVSHWRNDPNGDFFAHVAEPGLETYHYERMPE